MNKYLIDMCLKQGLVNVVIGASGANKTTWVLQELEAMANNSDFFGFTTSKLPKTHYMAMDRASMELEAKFKTISIASNENFTYESYASKLRELNGVQHILKMRIPKETKLIVIDGIGFVVPGRIISQRDVGLVISDCLSFCEENQATIILIHHTAKAKQNAGYTNPREKGLGSGAWVQMAGTTVLMEQENPVDITNNGRIAYIMQNDNPGIILPMTVNTETGRLDLKDLAAAPGLQNLKRSLKVLETLSSPFSTENIVAAGVSRSTAHRYITLWIESGYIERIAYGKYSALKSTT